MDHIWEKSLHADFALLCGPEFVTLRHKQDILPNEAYLEFSGLTLTATLMLAATPPPEPTAPATAPRMEPNSVKDFFRIEKRSYYLMQRRSHQTGEYQTVF